MAFRPKIGFVGSVLIASGLLLTVRSALAQEITQVEDGLWISGEQKASLVMPKSQYLIIRSAVSVRGQIEIETGYVKEAQLTYTKKAKSSSRGLALDYVDALSVSLDAFGGKGRLEFRAPNPAPWSGSNDAGLVIAKLIVPKGTFVEIIAAYIDVKASGPLSGLVVSSSFGRIEASRIDSVLDISTANQPVILDQITGDVSAATTNASITASHIVAKGLAARFKNENGDIKLDSVAGSVNVRNNFGKIAINRFMASGDGSSIKGASGPVSVDLIDLKGGSLSISNRLEDIELRIPEKLSAFLALSVEEEGKIDASGFRFTTDLVQRDRLNIVVGGGKGNISCAIKGKGNIYVHGGSAE